ncbi:MAG TPA: hypothetical protein VLA95_07920 [Gemmatimonadales bacterium]|nr:hypothetical protein [Gemmatimonadales bacterium]HSE28144.1 hypothetical protein [Gemmatimonadales bacterium]
MEIVLASDQDRPNLFAELRVDGQPWAEVIYDAQREAYILTVLIGEERDWLSFDVAEVRRALAAAKDALVKRGYPDLSV